MKKSILLALFSLLFFGGIYAQTVPQGMNYQAVARNTTGNVLANQQISLRINLVTKTKAATVHYSEVHAVTTNQLGLFTLVIGEGKVEKGTFKKVPWSTDDIWMEVSIKDKDASTFVAISSSKLLAVPYAFHAGTANQLVSGSKSSESLSLAPAAAASSPGVPSSVWSTKGNSKTDPLSDRLGTTDVADLLVITNNIERLRILANGDIKTTNTTESNSINDGALVVAGGVGIAKNLNVGGKINITGGVTIQGATSINNKLDVTGITSIKNNTSSTASNNGALVVSGGVGIGENLNVGGSVNFKGASTLGGQLHITDKTSSTSTITGALVVDGGTGIAENLNVGGMANVTGATTLSNTLSVTGATTLANSLDVTGATTLISTFDVSGKSRFRDSVTFDKTVSTSGAMTSTSLAISGNSSNYLATFENKNDGEGDGLKIKLGRAKSSYTIPAAPDLGASDAFADLLSCKIPETEKVTILFNIAKDDAIETAKTMAGIAVSAGNMIINVINSGLQLPLSIPDITIPAFHISDAIDVTGPINTKLNLPIVLPAITVPEIKFPKLSTPGITIDVPLIPTFTIPGATIINEYQLVPPINLIGATTVMPKLPALTIPALDIPRTTILTSREVMPKLPKIDLTSIGIPEIDISSLKFWGLDINICLDEKSSSPLNNSNEFIRFADKNDAQVGAIRGVSVANWSANYLNPVFFNKLRGAFLSSKADKFHAQYHFKQEVGTALASYAKIGVEYSSGNGDYAEWLERSDKAEVVSAGDIVSVKGGKITKDLSNAEQVMVVSHAPIMLGNVPEGNKTDLGNSIVFIGQAPVKILGPVKSGDFIIGQISTPGYGIAKHPNDMTVEDFKLAVGRSWDTDETEGIKMANTVIGVHNSAFLNLIKDLKEKADTNDARLKAIEAKLGIAAPVKKGSTATKTKK